MELYTSFRSIAAHRVRIALQLKGLSYRAVPIAMSVDSGDDPAGPDYRMVNPQGLVPTLGDREFKLSQSLAIIEYLDDLYPDPPLLPRDPRRRARARQYAQILATDVQPLTSPRVQHYLQTVLRADQKALASWCQHWLVEGFDALELWLAAEPSVGPYCLGDDISLADIVLVPQIAHARELGIVMEDFPTLCDITENCERLTAFQSAAPRAQPDAPT